MKKSRNEKFFLSAAALRASQSVVAAFKPLLPWRTQLLLQGEGCSAKLAAVICQYGVRRLLLVTDPALLKLGLCAPLCQALATMSIQVTVFSAVSAEPTVGCVEAALALYREKGCEGLVAVGGGSPMDCAKGVAARVARPRSSLNRLAGLLKVGKKVPPFFAVPTTAGTGSEVTIAAVLKDEHTHHKYAINDPSLVPLAAALDPLLTLGLPPHITAFTGMDALTHAVEAYTNKFSTVTAAKAEEAVALIFRWLPLACADGQNAEARAGMLRASYLAGQAFTRSGVGYVHAVAHTIGGLYGVPHGLANAVVLPAVLRQFGTSVTQPLAALADAVQNRDGEAAAWAGLPAQGTPQQKADAFIAAIEAFNAAHSIPAGFEQIRSQDIPQMVAWAKAEARFVYPTPQLWSNAGFTRLLQKLQLPQVSAET